MENQELQKKLKQMSKYPFIAWGIWFVWLLLIVGGVLNFLFSLFGRLDMGVSSYLLGLSLSLALTPHFLTEASKEVDKLKEGLKEKYQKEAPVKEQE